MQHGFRQQKHVIVEPVAAFSIYYLHKTKSKQNLIVHVLISIYFIVSRFVITGYYLYDSQKSVNLLLSSGLP
jgi:hypothetical protein